MVSCRGDRRTTCQGWHHAASRSITASRCHGLGSRYHYASISVIIIFILLINPGAKIAGHRGYFLTNDGVDLNQAMISYGLDFLRKRGYKKIQPPFMMNKEQMAKTAQLDQFDEELYKVPHYPHPVFQYSYRLNGYRLSAQMNST